MNYLPHLKGGLTGNRAIMYSIATNIVALILGTLTVYFIAHHFSKEIQGYHYTFGSLMILQTLLEFGMGQATIQFISNEWGKLNIQSFSYSNISKSNFRPITDIINLNITWYAATSLIIFFVITPLGYVFFNSSGHEVNVNWIWPWILLCIITGFNTLLMPFFYLIQGCNQVKDYWFFRFLQQSTSGIVAILAILFGALLYTYTLISISLVLVGLLFILIKFGKIIFFVLKNYRFKINIPQSREVWSLQWRIALSTFTVVYSLQAFVLILFKYSGPIAAGQMGMSLTLLNIILAISSNWLIVNAPRFGILVANNERTILQSEFRKSLLRALQFAIVGVIFMLLSVYILDIYYHDLAVRILPIELLALMAISVIINTLLVGFSTYFRAHKKEPLIYIYAASNIIVLALAPFIAKKFGVLGLITEYLLVLLLIQLPLSVFIFRRFVNRKD
ncbi:MAG: hypothetical protein HXY50_06860 [Ignavibacteriaceae bacterium]|nr:hypothetical protein [Ignavibacteriaceae bacterium]